MHNFLKPAHSDSISQAGLRLTVSISLFFFLGACGKSIDLDGSQRRSQKSQIVDVPVASPKPLTNSNSNASPAQSERQGAQNGINRDGAQNSDTDTPRDATTDASDLTALNAENLVTGTGTAASSPPNTLTTIQDPLNSQASSISSGADLNNVVSGLPPAQVTNHVTNSTTNVTNNVTHTTNNTLINNCNYNWGNVAISRPWAKSGASKMAIAYLAFVNRAPDPDGLNYWMQHINTRSTEKIYSDFAKTRESFDTLFSVSGRYSASQAAIRLYDFVLKRSHTHLGDTGHVFWGDHLNRVLPNSPNFANYSADSAGLLEVAKIVESFISAVQASNEKDALDNRTQVALYFVDQTVSNSCPYSAELARKALLKVDKNAASVIEGKRTIDSFIADLRKTQAAN